MHSVAARELPKLCLPTHTHWPHAPMLAKQQGELRPAARLHHHCPCAKVEPCSKGWHMSPCGCQGGWHMPPFVCTASVMPAALNKSVLACGARG
jgi:hypothetical protein